MGDSTRTAAATEEAARLVRAAEATDRIVALDQSDQRRFAALLGRNPAGLAFVEHILNLINPSKGG